MEQDFDEELNIDFKKIFFILFYRKNLIFKTFIIVLVFFIALTFILPKKYKTDADLYINKSNNTNLAELNPYIISSLTGGEGISGMLNAMGGGLQNEIEIIKSPLVIDNVIKENNLRYKNGRKKGELISTLYFIVQPLSSFILLLFFSSSNSSLVNSFFSLSAIKI